MRKKTMMVAMLVGALSLGACVENNESASVEAVRVAKAAQLNSIAAMNNAEAECQKALAAYKKAEAEIKQMEADIQKARLEIDIEAAKINAEAALQRAKAELEVAKAALIANLDLVDAATKKRVTDLLGEADKELNKLNSTRLNLVTAKNDLLKANYDLISAEALKEQIIIGAKVDKANAEALIAEYKKYKKEDIVNAQKNADVAEAAAKGLNSVKDAKYGAFMAANDAYTATVKAVDGSLYNKTLERLGADFYTTELVVAAEQVSFAHENGAGDIVTKVAVSKKVVKSSKFEEVINEVSRSIDIERARLKECEKELEEKKASPSYRNKKDDVTRALREYNEATSSADKATKKIALDDAEAALKAYTVSEEAAVTSSRESIKTLEATLKDKKDDFAAVVGDYATTYTSYIDKQVAARNTKANAEIASEIAANSAAVQNALAASLRNVADGLSDYATLIEQQNILVAEADKTIADAEAILTKKDAITKLEKQIEKYELDLIVHEANYTSYMNQIKSLIGGGK